ncbi:MAG: Ada metal-binding domain-containing protein [Candidatus Omnitrophica bacterium]|nr:Ada metal-binding domain-containing protein [Candidatus Omnitrophota bacterium]
MKRLILQVSGGTMMLSFLIATCLIASPVYAAKISKPKEIFVATRNAARYHIPSCIWAENIRPENKVMFVSNAEATNAGYRPCKTCHPDKTADKIANVE